VVISLKRQMTEKPLLECDTVRKFACFTSHRFCSDLSSQVYYQLYTKNGEMASKVAIAPEEPSLGRIHADSVAPPHTPSAIRGRISKVEGVSALASAKLFADRSCETPMTDTHIPLINGKCPGLNLSLPMALVADRTQLIVSTEPSDSYTRKIKSRHDTSEQNLVVE
jgi:hypothetical protein